MRTIRTTLAIALPAALAAGRAAGAPAETTAGGAPPLIELPLVLTQILGFLILLWVLRAFAWGPLVGLLEERRRKIAGEFAEADRRNADAEALKARYEQELKGIEAQARQRILEAVAEGQRVAGEIKTQAHADATARLARAEEEVLHEREKAREVLKQQMAVISIHTAERILRERLDEPAQRRLVERFIEEVDRRP
jgi:F-type H+-transporting ATPase subunit b